MAAVRPPRNQDIADDAADAAARHEHTRAFLPGAVELVEKRLVVVDAAELPPAGIRSIGLQIEIGR
jgi:hypothetical protein